MNWNGNVGILKEHFATGSTRICPNAKGFFHILVKFRAANGETLVKIMTFQFPDVTHIIKESQLKYTPQICDHDFVMLNVVGMLSAL